MADLNNNNQDGDLPEGDSQEQDRSFGEVAQREDGEGESQDQAREPESKDQPQGKEAEGKEGDKKTELTEKGTKLDPNPQSAIHQQLANEKKVRSQMEQVLGNPQLLTNFMKTQYGIEATQPKKEEDSTGQKAWTAADLENLDDVAKVLNTIQTSFADKSKSYESKIQQLEQTVQNLSYGNRAQQVATTTERDVASLQKEPELDSTNSEFIEGLEGDIAEMYHKLDFDEQTGTYKGQYSVKDVGTAMIKAARKARQKGSERAQTVVKDKSAGKVTTSPKVDSADTEEEKKDPGASIADGISKMFR